MDQDLQRTCELFIKNRDLLADTFRWDGSAMHLIGSAALTSHEISADIDSLKNCAGIIKDRAGMLSPLRGHLKLMMIAGMMMSSDPEEYFDNVERAYSLIRITRKNRDQRYFLAAMAMSNAVADKDELLVLTDRAGELFEELSGTCGFPQDETGYVTSAVIAAAGITDAAGFASEVRKCDAELGDDFASGPDRASLCCILAMDKADAGFKCARFREILRMIDSAGVRYGRGSELAVLGSLTMLDMTNADAAAALGEADSYLRGQAGFGRFGCGPDMRHMYAALMVMSAYASAVQAGEFAEISVADSAVRSQFAAMAASTVMITSAAFDALGTELNV